MSMESRKMVSRFFSPRRNAAAARGLLRRLRRGKSGVAAIEFAFILPAMLTMYFGLTEVTQGVMADRKLTQLNRTMSDLASQATGIDATERDNIFNASKAVLMPFDPNGVSMVYSSVVIDSSGQAKVCWSEAMNGGALATGSPVALPAGLAVPSTSLIMAKSVMPYTPPVGYLMTGTINIGNETIYMRPRAGKRGGPQNIEQVERIGKALC